MEMSPTIKELASALNKAQSKLKNPTFDKKNPHYESRFASIASVRDTIMPVLVEFGLSVTQLVENDDNGRPAVTTMLMHDSGEWVRSRIVVPMAKYDAHQTGASLTYARRYALMAIVCVVGDEDNDANDAMERPQYRTHPADHDEDVFDQEHKEKLEAMVRECADVKALADLWGKLSMTEKRAVADVKNDVKRKLLRANVEAQE